jgi:hypothetical protein
MDGFHFSLIVGLIYGYISFIRYKMLKIIEKRLGYQIFFFWINLTFSNVTLPPSPKKIRFFFFLINLVTFQFLTRYPVGNVSKSKTLPMG